jgi:hypothetical protein
LEIHCDKGGFKTMNLNRLAMPALVLFLGTAGLTAARASGGVPPGGPDRGDRNMGPGQGMREDIQRRGFQDGMLGASRDFEHHRRPTPDNRDEYRKPNVPPGLQDAYREGFRRGYEQWWSQNGGRR